MWQCKIKSRCEVEWEESWFLGARPRFPKNECLLLPPAIQSVPSLSVGESPSFSDHALNTYNFHAAFKNMTTQIPLQSQTHNIETLKVETVCLISPDIAILALFLPLISSLMQAFPRYFPSATLGFRTFNPVHRAGEAGWKRQFRELLHCTDVPLTTSWGRSLSRNTKRLQNVRGGRACTPKLGWPVRLFALKAPAVQRESTWVTLVSVHLCLRLIWNLLGRPFGRCWQIFCAKARYIPLQDMTIFGDVCTVFDLFWTVWTENWLQRCSLQSDDRSDSMIGWLGKNLLPFFQISWFSRIFSKEAAKSAE